MSSYQVLVTIFSAKTKREIKEKKFVYLETALEFAVNNFISREKKIFVKIVEKFGDKFRACIIWNIELDSRGYLRFYRIDHRLSINQRKLPGDHKMEEIEM